MILGVHVDNPHIDHTVQPLLTQVPDYQVPLMHGFHCCPWLFVEYFSTVLISLSAPNRLTWYDEGDDMHVSWNQVLAGQICNPVTERVMSSCLEASLIAVEGVGDC